MAPFLPALLLLVLSITCFKEAQENCGVLLLCASVCLAVLAAFISEPPDMT